MEAINSSIDKPVNQVTAGVASSLSTLKPVRGVENYWIVGTPGHRGCIGIRYSMLRGRWEHQELLDAPERVAEDLRSHNLPRAKSGTHTASKACTCAQHVVSEAYPEFWEQFRL